ncbi:MAG TPA: hypothetical protein VE865_09335 [Bradyrhizobium sp.]|nr:hypothetical protein [Bradyrhizobium sp.]
MMMTRGILTIATLLMWSGAASAQVVKIPPIIMPAPSATAASPSPATTKAMFGCEAGGAKVCYFRIFYKPRGDRIVILPSGMKADVPGINIGGDYCMTLGSAPVWKCTRRTINDKYNS